MDTVGKEEWHYLKDYLKKRRQYVVSMGEKLDILLLHGEIRYEHWERPMVLSPVRKVANATATE